MSVACKINGLFIRVADTSRKIYKIANVAERYDRNFQEDTREICEIYVTSRRQDISRSTIINRDTRHILRKSACTSRPRESQAWVIIVDSSCGLRIDEYPSAEGRRIMVSWFTSRTACGLFPSNNNYCASIVVTMSSQSLCSVVSSRCVIIGRRRDD